jgi:5-carboxymethyl-2-hydroxymuconic-semialdehyde dehydrogenase
MSVLETNLKSWEDYFARFRQTGVLNRINGQDCAALSGETFQSISPVDGQVLCEVAKGAEADIDNAAKAAKDAFPAWRDMPLAERKKILHKVADAIVERADEIAFLECMDTGQAYRFMSKAALRGAENFRFFADRAPAARDGQALPSATLMNISSARLSISSRSNLSQSRNPSALSAIKLAASCRSRFT